MGPAGRQFRALLWKNWLCRIRHPVLSLAEFFWPCILFMILTILRFQEPPRHRDNCFLQPRDLPSRGVLPFVQSLLCNTGSTCRNGSYVGATEHHFRSSRSWAAAGRRPEKVNDLAFLEEMQGLAEEIYDVMDKAKTLQELWAGRSKGPDSSHGSGFLAMNLNKTEEVILKLEKLHQQPHIWEFLRLLPRVCADNTSVEDRVRGGVQLLQAALNSLATLDDSDWLPLNHTFSTVSEIVLNVTVSMLTFLQERRVATPESGYNLSLQKLAWDPQKVQADLKSRFGFDDLHAGQILNYSAELPEVFNQWQEGSLLQKVLEGIAHSLEALSSQLVEESEPRKVLEALHTLLLILSDSSAADGPSGNHTSPKALLYLQKLENVLQNLPPWPALKRLLLLHGALRNVIAQHLHFVQEVLVCLERSANSSKLGRPDQLKLEKGVFFWELKQLLMKDATDRCLNASLSGREALLCPGVWEGLGGLTCPHDSSNRTSALNELLSSAEDADRLLQELITGHTDTPVSVSEGFPGWQEVERQLADTGLSCTRLFRLLGAASSPGNGDVAGDCEDQLLAAAVFRTLEQVQLSLEETSYWKAFTGFIRKTCELVRYVNVPESVQNGLPAFSEESPCYEENMDWEIITDNYFEFLSKLLKSPAASISRVLNSSKELLLMEKRLHSLEDEQINFFLSLVGFLETLLPSPFDLPRAPKSHDLSSPTDTLLSTSHLWANHSRGLGRDPSPLDDTRKLLGFGKAGIEMVQALEHLWIEKELNNILRLMELVLLEMNPNVLELWMDGISKRERDTLETLSTRLNFSVPDETVLSKSFNFSQLFHSDWPLSTSLKTDFVHLSEIMINSLYEFGFLRQGQVSEALDIVYTMRNASELFSALPEPEKREVAKTLTQIHLSVFQEKDSALLLQIYSSWLQYMYKFLSFQSMDSLLPSLAQISKHILDIVKQRDFQNISEAFAFLYETTGVLEGISEGSEGSYCQQLLLLFNYLELQAQSLMSTLGPELEVIHATLTGLKQLFIVDEDFRISFFQYMSQLFNGSVEAPSGNECFALGNRNISSVNYSIDRGSSFILPWAQVLSHLSANGSVFNELMAVHCTVSWLQMWTDIWDSVSQIFKFDMNIFAPLHDGLTQLLDELQGDVKTFKSCQGIFPIHYPASLILNLLTNVTQADGFRDWDDFLSLRDLWVALGDALVSIKSLNPDRIEKSLYTMETALSQLKTFPLNTNASREFFYSLLDIFMELSNTSEYIDRNVRLINHFLSNNHTNHGVKFESVIAELRETILFLRNVSRDQDLLSCANIFQNVTEFILEDGLLYVNTSQRTLHILAVLNSTFSSEDTISRLKGCVAWVDVLNHLYMIYNSSVSQGYPRGVLKSFGDVKNKINSTLKLVTSMLNIKDPHCSLNKSDINCVNIVLKNVTDFLNAILTEVFEKEKVPKLEILLTLLNDSRNQVRMIINNLTRDFDFVSQSNWKRFTELVLRPTEMSDDLPSQFKNLWLHLVALGKEIQNLMKDISTHILESDSSSTSEKFLNIFATSLKERDVNSLGNSLYQLASHLAFNFSHDLQNPPEIIPHKVMKAVGLSIQLIKDVFNSLTPSVLHNVPQELGNNQVFKKVASLLHTLKKTDIDLLVDQLVQMSEALTDFFKNVSRLGPGSLRADLLVGLLEKFVDSSHSWNVNHLLKLSRLFPKDDVNAVVDAYYMLPHAVKLLQRGVDKNITEVLRDVYNFTVLHGVSISNVTKGDFAIVIKTLLDTVELISDKPAILSEALTCLPLVWCWNHTTSGLRQDPKVEACKSHPLTSSSFYSKVASVLDLLHLPLPGKGLQCSDEDSRQEITRKMVCVIRELAGWTSIFLELSEVFHVQTSLVKTMQEFWHKVLPFVSSSGNQSNSSISELCPSGPIEQVASQIITTLKSVNLTKVVSDENILDKLASLNKILNVNEGTETSVQNKISLNLERIMKLPFGDQRLENDAHSLDSPFVTFLDANLTGSGLEAPSSFTKTSEVTYNSSYFEELQLELQQIMTELSHDFPIRRLLSEINKQMRMSNSETLQNVTLQLARVFESLGSSSPKTSEIIEDFLLGMKNWLRKRANKDDSRMIQTLFLLMANESSTDDRVLWTKDFATFLGFLQAISREDDFGVAHLTQLLSQEQLTNLSLLHFLFESVLINSVSKLAGSSSEAASHSSDTDLQVMNFINLALNQTQSENGAGIVLPVRSTVDFMEQLWQTFLSFLLEENPENRISLLLKAFHKDIAAEVSVEMCQIFQQPRKPMEAVETLQKVMMLVLRVFLIFAENPSLTKDVLCAALSCQQGGVRQLVPPALQGAALVHDHYQEMEEMWSSPLQLDCESLSRNLSSTLETFKSSLEHATDQDCECQPGLGWAQQRVHTLAQSLEKTWLSGNPLMTFLRNFTVTEDVKVKDLMQNISKLTNELRSSIHLSDETIHSILEASISHSQVPWSILTVALSGRCDADALGLLLAFPEDEESGFAVQEVCALRGPEVYSLIVSMTKNLNLRSFIYKTLMPLEASSMLRSLLDVVSRLRHLLARAGRTLEYLPKFLRANRITALLDTPDFQQDPQNGQARSSAFGSFQSVMKKLCKEPASFFSGSNSFINLPRVNELLGGDKERFNIPEDSTPFCLNLYQEILQSPNGALVWSFLKPVLHGKILYTPNTPEINEIIQKANYTFYFVDKLKTLVGTLLKMSSIFQSGGSGQMLSQLQEALRNKFIRNFIESQLHIDVDELTEQLQTYGGKLDKLFAHTSAGRFHVLGRILVNLSSCVALNRFQALESVASLESQARELMQQNDFLASIIFNSSLAGRNLGKPSRQLPPHLTYTIRTSVLYSMRTDLVKNPFWKFHPQSLPADGFKYNYIFVPLQDMIERAIILVQTGQEAVELTTQTQAMPYPCHTSDLFLNNVGFFFPLIMMLTWMVSVASMVRKLVYEREIQIEEYMRMMGVHPAVFFLAWFLENMAMLAISSAALAVILKASGIFAHSNACIIFLFLLDFGVSVVMLSYFLSAFFSQANTAALCTSLVYMISFLPYIVLLVLHNQLTVVVQMFLCLLSTTAFGQGVFFVTFLEGQEAGLQWDNVYQPPEQTGMTFGWVCWMILFDSGLYFVCGWYLNNLIPGTFGLRKPWYFPFTASYWKNLCGFVARGPRAPGSHLSFSSENFDNKGSSPQNGEEKPGGGPLGVALVSVTKEYERHKAAVQDLTLTFHSGQITALLGTNGAGKTTVISMLTGLHPPTSGTIIINGKNLQTDLSAIRRELGVCPQQDVLFDNLTVLEHLVLFASIKAPQWTQKELRQQVHRTLEDVVLTQHQHKQARVLSGGMKRKLSIGIAFIGTSSTVVLDEPTSGVDPCSRRGIWDILLKYREGRTVIFTTHHLDEAEALSDRVALLQHGRLRCCGPPFCLTTAYGQGLSLTLTKQPSALEADDQKHIARATSLIQTYIPRAFLKDSSEAELVYGIPKDADRACFKGLFQALEQSLLPLHLTGFGISDATLEAVFLMLLQGPKKQSDVAPGAGLELQDRGPPEYRGAAAGTPCAPGVPRPVAQAAALLGKRLRRTRRAWKGALSDLLLPVLFVALAMGLFMVRPLAIDYPPLKLTPGHYDRGEAYFFSSGTQDQELIHVLLRKFGDQDPLCGGSSSDLSPDSKNSSCWRVDPPSHLRVQEPCACLICPNRSAGAPYLTNRLGHTLLNLSAFRLEEYLLVPSEKPRLGGWSFGVRIPDQVQDANPDTSKPNTLAKVWYNQKGFHSLPSYLNHLNNLILWRHLPPAVDWRRYGITLYSHPYGGALLNEDKILESIRQCGVALCIVLGFSILSASIGSSVVRDRVTGAKRLQHISGLGHRTYWLANFLYDMVFYLVSMCLCVTVIVAFQLTAFTFRQNLAATVLLLALFGYATLPWMYLMSRVFSSSDVAFIAYVSLNFIFGLCTMLMTIMPRLLAIISKAQNLQNIYDVLKWVFTIFPQFCLGQGLIELCYNQIRYDLTHNFGIDSYVSPFEMNFLGWIFVQLASQGTVLLVLRILLHWDLLQRPRGSSAIQGTVTSCRDVDVEKEEIRVLKGRTSEDLLVLYNLSKSYGSFCNRTTAVRDISVGIRRGECFGLLGANGAGKSTTFKMLTGDACPTSGHAVARTPSGEAVDLSLAGAAGVRIGYCPQQDALDELLTGWEHLHYYCVLRGVPRPCIPQVARDLVRRLHLEAHVDKLVATYSGGTKRKLSMALALLGKPDLLLLDEPSSGMDPCSKRYLWNTITQEARRGCAVVLTSHSMEECQALCTRLAIMVNGSFRCLGSPQHIKNRFGDGYIVKIWLCKETHPHRVVSDCLKLHFPGIQFKGQRLNLLEYHVPKQWECLADLFRVLENNKTCLNIQHYSIHQTTLEQVFINFATEQQKTSQSTLAPSTGRNEPRHLPI